MIIDHRTYTMYPGKLQAWLELWERMALPYQMKYLENFVRGWSVPSVGRNHFSLISFD